MRNFMIVILIVASLISCSDKESCAENCDPLQTCVDGVCECPEDYFKLDATCKKKNEGAYIGEISCGCFDRFILSVAFYEGDNKLYLSQGLGFTMFGPVTQLSDGSLKATLNKGCNLDNGTSYAVDFTVKELNENELHVHARWWNLEVGTLEECESVFVH